MFHRHAPTATAQPADSLSSPYGSGLADPAAPMRACCCPARPMYKVVMPPTAARPHPVDLWLCGHHCHVSRQALAAAGARVCRLGPPAVPAETATPASPAPGQDALT